MSPVLLGLSEEGSQVYVLNHSRCGPLGDMYTVDVGLRLTGVKALKSAGVAQGLHGCSGPALGWGPGGTRASGLHEFVKYERSASKVNRVLYVLYLSLSMKLIKLM